MESVKESLTSLAEVFHTTMDAFQRDLKKASPTSNSATNLSAEFTAFRSFILSALNTVQQQVSFLGRAVDNLEMQRRRKMLLFHGVAEDKSETDPHKIVTLVAEHLQVPNCNISSITKCYRLGKPSSKGPRPLVVKFSRGELRDQIWFHKTKLKGTGITQSEFLTKTRHDVFLLARQRFGVKKCWTRNGSICVLMSDGSRQVVETSQDIDLLCQQDLPIATTASKPINSKTTLGSKPEIPRSKRVLKK